MIREARPDEADLLAGIQREASVAGFAHIFPPDRYPYPIEDVRQRWVEALANPLNGETRVVPFPPKPFDVGYTIELA